VSGRSDPLTVTPVEVVDLIAEAALACPAVAGLHGGLFGQRNTYLPGRRVSGVTLSGDEAVVGVVGRYPASVAEIASQVRAAVGARVPGVPVTVDVEDLLLPGERLPGDNREPVDDPAGGAPRRPPFTQAEPVPPGTGSGAGPDGVADPGDPAGSASRRRTHSRTSTVGDALALPEKE
jgi:hypothetical protein